MIRTACADSTYDCQQPNKPDLVGVGGLVLFNWSLFAETCEGNVTAGTAQKKGALVPLAPVPGLSWTASQPRETTFSLNLSRSETTNKLGRCLQ